MKNLIVAAVLLAGTTFGFANVKSPNPTSSNSQGAETAKSVIFSHNAKTAEAINAFFSCYAQVIVNFETPCGEYVYSQASPRYSVNCLAGQSDGFVNTYYETRKLDGWNHGNGPSQPTNCLN